MFDSADVDEIAVGGPSADVWDGVGLPADEPSWLADDDVNIELELFTGTPRERLAAILTSRPCGRTMTALEELAQLPMDDAERVLFAKAWDRQAHAAQGTAIAALAEALGPPP